MGWNGCNLAPIIFHGSIIPAGLARLQRVQNAAARLVMGLSSRDHVGPALRELHWLPLAHRIKFKVALLMYLAHNRLSPLYITSQQHSHASATTFFRQQQLHCTKNKN